MGACIVFQRNHDIFPPFPKAMQSASMQQNLGFDLDDKLT